MSQIKLNIQVDLALTILVVLHCVPMFPVGQVVHWEISFSDHVLVNGYPSQLLGVYRRCHKEPPCAREKSSWNVGLHTDLSPSSGQGLPAVAVVFERVVVLGVQRFQGKLLEQVCAWEEQAREDRATRVVMNIRYRCCADSIGASEKPTLNERGRNIVPCTVHA